MEQMCSECANLGKDGVKLLSSNISGRASVVVLWCCKWVLRKVKSCRELGPPRFPHATRRKVHLHMHGNFWIHQFYRHNGDNKKTGEAFGSTSKCHPLIVARIRHTCPSHQSPQNRADSRPSCAEASAKVDCTAYTTTTGNTATTRLSNLYQEAQSYSHILGTTSVSNLCWEALRIRMAGRGLSREGTRGGG